MWIDLPFVLAQTEALDTPPSAAPQVHEAPPPRLDGLSAEGTGGTGDAQSIGGSGSAQPADPQNTPGGSMMPLITALAIGMLFIFLMGGGRREKKKRAAMLAALAKGDKVQTIGGIRGVVLEIKDDEILLKVDENANTRLRFASSAVQTVIEKKNGE